MQAPILGSVATSIVFKPEGNWWAYCLVVSQLMVVVEPWCQVKPGGSSDLDGGTMVPS
jgi:hypothetical protein